MKNAFALNFKTKNWEKVSADDFSFGGLNEDFFDYFKCTGCGAQASLVHSNIKEWYFRSLNHKKNCPVASAEKHRVERIRNGTIINTEKLLSGPDTERIEHGATLEDSDGENDDVILPEELNGEEEVFLDRHTKKIGTMSSLASEISKLRLDDSIGEIPLRCILCTEENVRLLSGAAWKGPLVVNLVRCSPTTCFPKGTIIPEGFLVFKLDFEDSNIYFLVKCKNPNNNQLFREEVLGHWETGEKSKPAGSIVTVFGNWSLFDILIDNSVLYSSEVNYCAIKISNKPVLPLDDL